MPITISSDYQPLIPAGGDTTLLTAIVTARYEETPEEQANVPDLLLGFICDTSNSMEGERIVNARDAIVSGIQMLMPKDHFFVITFSSTAELLVSIMQATDENKATAIAAVRSIKEDGGTEFSKALQLADDLFATMPMALKQGIFLTDGENNDCDRGPLAELIPGLQGRFCCSCRGVGVKFQAKEIELIANTLLGDAARIPSNDRVSADFKQIIERSMKMRIPQSEFRFWSPSMVAVENVKLMYPQKLDLTGKGRMEGQMQVFMTGPWASGDVREYMITLKVPQMQSGEKLVGEPSVVYSRAGEQVTVAGKKIFARFSSDSSLTSVMSKLVRHYTGQEPLKELVDAGIEALQAGNIDGATQKLGQARKIAASANNTAVLELIDQVVEAQSDGTIKLRSGVGAGAVMDLQLGSSKTTRLSK